VDAVIGQAAAFLQALGILHQRVGGRVVAQQASNVPSHSSPLRPGWRRCADRRSPVAA
jgi:hypothetical protein